MLKRIRIKNYKNLRDTGDIELGPINLLVGPNGAGKTALWEILWRINRLFRNEDFQEIWRDYEDVVSDRDLKRPISFECSADVEGGNLVYSLTLSRLRLEEEKIVLNDRVVSHAYRDEKDRLVFPEEYPEPFTGMGRTWVRPYLPLTQYNPGVGEWGLFRFFNILDIGKPEHMRGNLIADRLSDDGLNIAAVLWETKDKGNELYNEIKEIMEEITGYEMDSRFLRQANTFYLNLMHGEEFFVRLENWPDGWKQILLILTALKTAKGLVFIEEPETHLHPDLFRFLRGQIEEAADRGVQVILSTHNLSFVNQFRFDEVILVEGGKFRKPKKGKWLEECALSLGEIITSSLVEDEE